MSEPQPFVINLLQQMIATQQETNTLLKRIVPDGLPTSANLFEMIRDGLFLALGGGGEEPPVYRPLPVVMGDLLRSNPDGVSAANILASLDVGLNIVGANAALSATRLQDLLAVVSAQLQPGTITLSIAEQVNIIREASQALQAAIGSSEPGAIGDGTLGKLDRIGNLLLANGAEQLYTDPNGLAYNAATLIYALGLCSCASFPALPGPTEPGEDTEPSQFLVSCGTADADLLIRPTSFTLDGQNTINTIVYDRWSAQWPASSPLVGNKQFIRNSGSNRVYRIQDAAGATNSAGLHTAFPPALAPTFIRRLGAGDVTTVVSSTAVPSSTGMPALPQGCNTQAGANLVSPSNADPVWYSVRIFYPVGESPPPEEMRHVYITLNA